ncbi:MAG: hypothetical protein ICV60_03405 [Pyrinomonadaceae bacterium]|nr:hypothetical protein [Pyrinomonadaceae bacterium]
MNSRKCPRCGPVNFAGTEVCKRCGTALGEADSHAPDEAAKAVRGFGWLIKRALVVLSVVLALLLIFYGSLLKSSERLSYDQQQVLASSINTLEAGGFSREAFILRNFVAFRATDNWWNRYVGHREAYAATNFPFEVVTLYPEFFNNAVDDTERAAILLHESYHLFGSGEQPALEGTWRNKKRLGWTKDKYAQTKVFRNTRELTVNQVPQLFQCGLENNADCTDF